MELVGLTVADDATGDGDIDLPSKGGGDDQFVHPHAAEGGGIGAAAISVPVTNDADQPKEQQPGDLWFCTMMVS